IGLCIGTIINSGGIFITQIAVQSVYVVVVPATSTTMPFPRTLDALTGSMCAILLAFLIPRDARKVPRRLAADMLEEINDVFKMMKRALSDADSTMANRALERARETQDIIDSWGSSLRDSREAARWSAMVRRSAAGERSAHVPPPPRVTTDIIVSWGTSLRISREAAKINARARRHAAEVTRLSRAHTFSDRAMRTMRVIARRVVGMTELGVEKPVIADYVGSLADGATQLEI